MNCNTVTITNNQRISEMIASFAVGCGITLALVQLLKQKGDDD